MAHLGGFSEEALQLFQLAASEQAYEFSEGGEVYDFTRCMRADGSFYGTRGTCKKGSQAGAKEKEAPKTEGGKKRRATAEGKAAAKAESKKAAGAKVSDNARRSRLLKEELANVREKMKGASPEEQNRLLQEASKKADERHRAGAEAARPETAKEKKRDRAEVNKMGRTADQLTPQEKAARAARQAAKVTATPGMAANAKAAREKLGADKAPATEAKPKKMKTDFRKDVEKSTEKRRAKEAKIGELRTEIANRKKTWQESEAKVREAKKAWTSVNAMTAAQKKTPEGRKKLLEAGRALDKAERAAQKASDRYGSASKKMSLMTMTPEQRKQEREWNRTKRELG